MWFNLIPRIVACLRPIDSIHRGLASKCAICVNDRSESRLSSTYYASVCAPRVAADQPVHSRLQIDAAQSMDAVDDFRRSEVNIGKESSRFVSVGTPLAMHFRGLHRTPDVIDLLQIGIRNHLARRPRLRLVFVYDLCDRVTRIVTGGIYRSRVTAALTKTGGKKETREGVEVKIDRRFAHLNRKIRKHNEGLFISEL
ncbi:Uncharacterized protein DBV15_00103 [Temnothorax longispinosus]|uniref:Uncharacterized protein n=1 Tax=Temnothorax longispinosus TaxID=300112 RepID=A0A4S2KE18_9HYME|nr:Uncharacterized protein DBV15_00103 [Temnothorax longispinosus]